ncbi:hypothetical protein ACFYXF_47950 [Streptomyces sp. NPDC002680]|uniref:hypothetical protein n=1 Tax=Streptomyces sp. NPDC002680 TaxID=3364659 RepID=UPI00369C56C9
MVIEAPQDSGLTLAARRSTGTDLPWSTLGALPEMPRQPSAPHHGLDPKSRQTPLIRRDVHGRPERGALAKGTYATAIATTRRPARADMLRWLGVDHPVMDDGKIAATPTPSAQTVWAWRWCWSAAEPCRTRKVRVHGTAHFTGAVGRPADDPGLRLRPLLRRRVRHPRVEQHSRLDTRGLTNRMTTGDEDCVSSP